MKKIYVLMIMIGSVHLFAQKFTVGTVFDHNVGDTIIEEYTEYLASSNGPPRTTLRAFINKSIVPTLDTIYYAEHVVSNQYQWNGSGYVMSYTNTIKNYYKTKLNDTLINYAFQYLPSCQYQRDTTFIDSCGFKVHEKELFLQPNNQGCFEPHWFKDTYIERVGLYQIIQCGNCLPRGLKTINRLLYTNKGNHCGKSIMIATGLKNEIKPAHAFSIYPNPSEGVYHLVSENYGKLEVFDNFGKSVKHILVIPGANTFDLKDQPEGIYYLKIVGQGMAKKIVKY